MGWLSLLLTAWVCLFKVCRKVEGATLHCERAFVILQTGFNVYVERLGLQHDGIYS